jgi:hypothetical protein
MSGTDRKAPAHAGAGMGARIRRDAGALYGAPLPLGFMREGKRDDDDRRRPRFDKEQGRRSFGGLTIPLETSHHHTAPAAA